MAATDNLSKLTMSEELDETVKKGKKTPGILLGSNDVVDRALMAKKKKEEFTGAVRGKQSDFKTDKRSCSFLKKTAQEYAAESLAVCMDEWVIYDPSCNGLDEWLDTNLPSVLSRDDHIGWICVEGNQNKDSEDFCDYEQLDRGWEELKKSGEAINYHSIIKLAKDCNVLMGFWLFYVRGGYYIDIIWSKIAKQMIGGVLENIALQALVSPKSPDKHVVIIENKDCTNEWEVLELHSALRKAGVKSELKYKPEIYTHLGIYRNNEWKIRPSIYQSNYDVLTKESMVISLYDKA